MQVELSNDEIKLVHGLLDEAVYIGKCKVSGIDELLDRFSGFVEEAEELESIDLNDCGDSCKL